ncbi:nucleotidyltransferase, partial [Bacillus cereus]
MIEKLAFITYEQHKKLVQTIVAEILSIDTVNGCMLIGSVSRGDAYPDSDLDLSLKH